LGGLYEHGQGVTQDEAEAARWYRKAAEQGYSSAQVDLGFLSEAGLGVPRDYAQAAMWYRKAAEQGNPAGLADLALMYQSGHEVRRSREVAYALLDLAARPGGRIGTQAASKRDALAKTLTAKQLEDARALAGSIAADPMHLGATIDGFLARSPKAKP
jgi:hypothetical protein